MQFVMMPGEMFGAGPALFALFMCKYSGRPARPPSTCSSESAEASRCTSPSPVGHRVVEERRARCTRPTASTSAAGRSYDPLISSYWIGAPAALRRSKRKSQSTRAADVAAGAGRGRGWERGAPGTHRSGSGGTMEASLFYGFRGVATLRGGSAVGWQRGRCHPGEPTGWQITVAHPEPVEQYASVYLPGACAKGYGLLSIALLPFPWLSLRLKPFCNYSRPVHPT